MISPSSDGFNMMTDEGVKWHSVLTDLITLGTGGIVLLIFFVGVSPMRRGFYCDDETIRYPFLESTIPNWALYIYCLTIPFLVISVTEFMTHHRSRASGTFLSRPVPTWFNHVYRSLIDFLFGCVASQLVTDVGKYTIGRLRPNFIDVCKPNITLHDCSHLENYYIENYYCTNSVANDAKESRVSFPSGHSSFSAYCMLYIAIYIQLKWNVNKRSYMRLVKGGTQVCLILIAYYTALSRVMDNKHHWSDVSVGALIGVVTASLTVRYISCLLARPSSPPEDKAASAAAYSINSAVASNNSRRSPSNFDLEAQRSPAEHPAGDL